MSCQLKKTQLTRRKGFAEKNVFRKQGDRFLADVNAKPLENVVVKEKNCQIKA